MGHGAARTLFRYCWVLAYNSRPRLHCRLRALVLALGPYLYRYHNFVAALEIRDNFEAWKWVSNFPVRENSGNFGKTATTKSGKTQEICESDPEGKGFRQFGVCVSCAMCPSWIILKVTAVARSSELWPAPASERAQRSTRLRMPRILGKKWKVSSHVGPFPCRPVMSAPRQLRQSCPPLARAYAVRLFTKWKKHP